MRAGATEMLYPMGEGPHPDPLPEGEGRLPPFGVNLILMHPQLAELVVVQISWSCQLVHLHQQ